MGRPRLYATATERQRAHRQKQKDQDAATARLMARQDDAAHTHVVVRFGMLHVQKHATAEQLQLQAERKERDMMDALWTLQTLIADFGYDEVHRHVLQHLRPTPRPCATTSRHTTQRDTDCCKRVGAHPRGPEKPLGASVHLTHVSHTPESRRAYHLVCLEQEAWSDGQAERLSGLEIDDQIELQGAFHRRVRGLGLFGGAAMTPAVAPQGGEWTISCQ